MTSTEYDRIRLEALPAAQQLINDTRYKLAGVNETAWHLLVRAGKHLQDQLAAEWAAYFAPEPEPEPPAASLSEYRAAYLEKLVKDRADAIRNPEPEPSKFNLDVADLRGLPTIVSDTPHSCEAPVLLSLISGTKGGRQ